MHQYFNWMNCKVKRSGGHVRPVGHGGASRRLAFTSRQTGMILPLVAVGIVALFGMAGLALDAGQAYMVRTAVQNAADAAALAGAQELKASGDTTAATNAALATAKANGFKDGAENTTVSSPLIDGTKVTVNITRNIDTVFSRVIGRNAFNIAATATADLVPPSAGDTGPGGQGGQPCAMGLATSGKGLIVANSAKLIGEYVDDKGATVTGCTGKQDQGCRVYINSNAKVDRADSIDAILNIASPGTCENKKDPTNCGSCQAVGQATCDDPFAKLPWPAKPNPNSACDSGNTDIEVKKQDATKAKPRVFSPGVYCGKSGRAIEVGQNAYVKFSPGRYIIYGGGLLFDNNSVVTSDPPPSSGAGVTFISTGDNDKYKPGEFTISGADVTLYAPTKDTTYGLAGMLYMQDPINDEKVYIQNQSHLNLNGNLYLPNGEFYIKNHTGAKAGSIIAKTLTFENNSSITMTNKYQVAGCLVKQPGLVK